MTLDDYNILNEMLQELRQESTEMDAEMNRNLRYIREAEIHLKSFTESESDDFKVFSPRKAGIIHKEEIEKICSEKTDYEEKNQELNRKRQALAARIAKLENILRHRECDFDLQAENIRKRQDSLAQNLEELVHKMELSSACIDRNPIQARQDFAIIGKCLKEIAEKIRDEHC